MSDPKPTIIRVTRTDDYIVDPKILAANGWTVEQLIADWFGPGRLRSHHATREAFHVGNSGQFVSMEVIE